MIAKAADVWVALWLTAMANLLGLAMTLICRIISENNPPTVKHSYPTLFLQTRKHGSGFHQN